MKNRPDGKRQGGSIYNQQLIYIATDFTVCTILPAIL